MLMATPVQTPAAALQLTVQSAFCGHVITASRHPLFPEQSTVQSSSSLHTKLKFLHDVEVQSMVHADPPDCVVQLHSFAVVGH
mmetsp:Transcript_24321/g.39142  ORF Transcript_24321/g.39142 Transcript_24321/m.39142 type:complete len:83 (+) Transcript_24321:130-378(+)